MVSKDSEIQVLRRKAAVIAGERIARAAQQPTWRDMSNEAVDYTERLIYDTAYKEVLKEAFERPKRAKADKKRKADRAARRATRKSRK